jgi:hypothetical protein
LRRGNQGKDEEESKGKSSNPRYGAEILHEFLLNYENELLNPVHGSIESPKGFWRNGGELAGK